MTSTAILFFYVVSLLAAISCVALFYRRRNKRFEPASSSDRIFRCEKCFFVYTDDADVDRSRCPQCGTVNEKYDF